MPNEKVELEHRIDYTTGAAEEEFVRDNRHISAPPTSNARLAGGRWHSHRASKTYGNRG